MAATKKKKKVDPIKQREKRVKIAAIVGTVLFLAVAAYEIPSMLAVMNKKAPPGSTYDPGPSSVLPNVAGGSATSAAPTGQLVNTDVPPSSQAGQLVSFSVFQTKNPFTPQVTSSDASASRSVSSSDAGVAGKAGADVPAASTTTTRTTTTTTPTSTTATPTATPAAPGASVVLSSAPPTTTTPTTPTTTTSAAATTAPTVTTPVQPTVSISVNGTVSRVGSQGTFPTGAPVFRLIARTKASVQIGIVGGSYATGDAALTLRVHEPVTLENQTDGKRYRIELLSTP